MLKVNMTSVFSLFKHQFYFSNVTSLILALTCDRVSCFCLDAAVSCVRVHNKPQCDANC